jgi:DNA processing protein
LERWLPRLSLRTAIRALEAAAAVGAVLVTRGDEVWPTGFGDLGDGAPIALWVRGDVGSLKACDRSIALVGARAATGYGEHVAMEAAAGLSDRGFAVVSGGAYGIDGAAHRAALASDQTTIAFLAGGVDRLYPAGHAALLTRIAERGLLVGELPCGSSPTKWRFLQRNRLIAAASRATVVVEAGRRSGSLNTAGHAAAIGRPLGAVPGPVTSPASAGCHRLIQEYGAACVTSAAEMAELTGIIDPLETAGEGQASTSLSAADHGERIRVLDALSPRTPRPVREVATRAGMSEREAISTLGLLDVESLVDEREGGWIRRARNPR